MEMGIENAMPTYAGGLGVLRWAAAHVVPDLVLRSLV